MKLWTDKNYPIIISCAKELSRWTEVEVRDLGYEPIEVTENTVVVRGAMRDVMRLNLYLRTAHRVLVPLLRTTCRNIRDLYQAVYSIDWENHIEADGYFSVSSVVHNFTIRDTRIPSLLLIVCETNAKGVRIPVEKITEAQYLSIGNAMKP